MYGGSGGWTQDDFADSPITGPAEYDPWAVQSDYDGVDAHPADSRIPPTIDPKGQRPLTASTLDVEDDDDIDGADTDDWDGEYDSESSAEMSALLEWDEINFSDAEFGHHSGLNGEAVDDTYLDEPEPLIEYDSLLRKPLYQVDIDDSDLFRTFPVDQLVSSIDEMNDSQAGESTDLLLDFSTSRLRIWLPWLRRQNWTGESLLLFLQFRVYWEENSGLWEASFWDSRFGCWRPTWSRYNLSRDDQFDLIQSRMGHSPESVIDGAWFQDWERFALWKYGFQAFAEFALFRALIADGEDWRNLVDWYHSNSIVQNDHQSEDGWSIDGLISRTDKRSSPVFWFASQDWYDSLEWHDGLGW